MTWYEMNQQRKLNRKNRNFRDGHRRRSRSFFALLEKSSGEVVVQAHDGCFGRLSELAATRDEYDFWAAGTRGEL